MGTSMEGWTLDKDSEAYKTGVKDGMNGQTRDPSRHGYETDAETSNYKAGYDYGKKNKDTKTADSSSSSGDPENVDGGRKRYRKSRKQRKSSKKTMKKKSRKHRK